METTTYAAAIGSFVRGFRREHGLTLESIARCARDYGASWSLSSVQAIEAGRAAPTLPTMLTLALVLGELGGKPLRLIDLLGQAELFDRPCIGEGDGPAPRSMVESALTGQPVQASPWPQEAIDAQPWILRDLPFGSSETLSKAQDRLKPLKVDESVDEVVRARGSGPMTSEERENMIAGLLDEYQQPPEPDEVDEECPELAAHEGAPPTLAEQRAAKKLGITATELQMQAMELWGFSLEQESGRRAGPGSSPQARGRVTRVLLDEMREASESSGGEH